MNNITIKVSDFNSVAKQPELISQLRKLTLNRFSGMNYELTHLIRKARYRNVNCRIIMAMIGEELVGWSLLSREHTDFLFPTGENYDPIFGFLFQIYTSPDHRKKGIGAEIIKVARRLSGPYKLCVCPWDNRSCEFFSKFNYKFKVL